MTMKVEKSVAQSNVVQTFKQNQPESSPKEKNRTVSTKAIVTALGAIGLTTWAILALKNKKKVSGKDIENIIGKDPKVEKLTDVEKEKLIKELQAKTDNFEVKEEIRRLVENGEWDKL